MTPDEHGSKIYAELNTMNKPARRLFQIHLSTAIVLMFAAGGIIWANTTERQSPHNLTLTRGRTIIGLYSYYGWPWNAYLEGKNAYYQAPTDDWKITHSGRKFFKSDAALNAGVAVLILVTTCLLCEWLARSRKNRKEP